MNLNNYPTFEIVSVQDHERLLQERCAVLCVWFEWSQPAILARGAVRYWHERWHLYCKVPVAALYMLNGDAVPALHSWVRGIPCAARGNGAVQLFVQGKLVENYASLLDVGLVGLSRVCEKHFEEGKRG